MWCMQNAQASTTHDCVQKHLTPTSSLWGWPDFAGADRCWIQKKFYSPAGNVKLKCGQCNIFVTVLFTAWEKYQRYRNDLVWLPVAWWWLEALAKTHTHADLPLSVGYGSPNHSSYRFPSTLNPCRTGRLMKYYFICVKHLEWWLRLFIRLIGPQHAHIFG